MFDFQETDSIDVESIYDHEQGHVSCFAYFLQNKLQEKVNHLWSYVPIMVCFHYGICKLHYFVLTLLQTLHDSLQMYLRFCR